jgi:hypothetical protein
MASWLANWFGIWQLGLQKLKGSIQRACDAAESKPNHFFAYFANVFRATDVGGVAMTGNSAKRQQCQIWPSKCYSLAKYAIFVYAVNINPIICSTHASWFRYD